MIPLFCREQKVYYYERCRLDQREGTSDRVKPPPPATLTCSQFCVIVMACPISIQLTLLSQFFVSASTSEEVISMWLLVRIIFRTHCDGKSQQRRKRNLARHEHRTNPGYISAQISGYDPKDTIYRITNPDDDVMPVKAHFTQLFVLPRNGPPEKSGLQSVWRRYVISSQPRVFKQFIHPYQSYCGVGQGIWQKNRPILLVNRNLAQNWCSINVLPSKVTYGIWK